MFFYLWQNAIAYPFIKFRLEIFQWKDNLAYPHITLYVHRIFKGEISSIIQRRAFSDSKKWKKINDMQIENQPSLKVYCFVFLSYELWIELLHRIWSGWNVISETDPYLLNVSFVSLILWALPSYFIVSGPELWSCNKLWLATQTFALVWHTEGHGYTQKI